MARNPAKRRIQEEIQAMGAADRAAGGVLFKVLDELDAMQEGIDNAGGGGDVAKVGTPVDNELAVWTGDGTLEGEANLTYAPNLFTVNSAALRLDSGRPLQFGGLNTTIYGSDVTDTLSLRINSNEVAEVNANGIDVTGDVTANGVTLTGGGGIETGATFPTSPTAGDFFWHNPTGRNILYQYNGASWDAIISEDSITVYIDSVNGTDDPDLGFGTGANAFASIPYAFTLIPAISGASVVINVADGTYSGFVQYVNHNNADLTISGTATVESTPTVTSSGLGFVTCSAESWTVDEHIGKTIDVPGITGKVWITSNTSDTLSFAGNIDPSSPATVDIERYPLIDTGPAFTGLNLKAGTVQLSSLSLTNSRAGGVTIIAKANTTVSFNTVKIATTANGRCLYAYGDSLNVVNYHMDCGLSTQILCYSYARSVVFSVGLFSAGTTTGSHAVINYTRGAFLEFIDTFIERRGIYLLEAGRVHASDNVEIENALSGIVEQDRLSGPHDLSGVTFTTVTLPLSLQSFRGALVGKSVTNVSTTAAWTAATFQVEQYDEGGWFTAGSPTRLTVPVGVSKVRVTGCIGVQGSASGIRIFSIRKNGSDTYGYGAIECTSSGTGDIKRNIQSAVLEVNEGDYFELSLYQTSGGDLTLLADGNIFLSIEQVE